MASVTRRTYLLVAASLVLSACSGRTGATPATEPSPTAQEPEAVSEGGQAEQQPDDTDIELDDVSMDEEAPRMRLSIGSTDLSVEWEDNQAVADLRALASEGPITVDLSMYGGFEQVGPLGTGLTTSDEQMTTEPGDIVLYAGDQISVFYGSNTWAYTKLGHVTDRTADEMANLLGNGDVSITIALG